VPAQVGGCLLGIPLEFEHLVSVRTLYIHCNACAKGCLCGLTFELTGTLWCADIDPRMKWRGK
jgi:hypothetical protein